MHISTVRVVMRFISPTYLGCSCDHHREYKQHPDAITKCINNTTRRYRKYLKRFFHNFAHVSLLLSKNININIYIIIILPVVLYGCATWSLTLRKERRLKVKQYKQPTGCINNNFKQLNMFRAIIQPILTFRVIISPILRSTRLCLQLVV